MTDERIELLRRWHDEVADDLRSYGARDVEHLGLRLHVPETVFPPAAMSALLGRAVLEETRPDDRVLDMGTGCGVNAILAARTSADVTAVDVNPNAVAAARSNARRHRVSERIRCVEGDLFGHVDGTFDLVVFDPPFRWFAPRDLLEVAFADEGYRTLTAFFEQVGSRLTDDGRVLLFFGTTGDVEYLEELVVTASLTSEVLATSELVRDGTTVSYFVTRLTA